MKTTILSLTLMAAAFGQSFTQLCSVEGDPFHPVEPCDGPPCMVDIWGKPTGGGEPCKPPKPSESKAWDRAYRWSVVATVAAAGADIGSSLHFAHDGQREANSFLAPNGRFGVRGASLEAGGIAANLLVQYFVVKRFPSTRKLFTVVNFGYAGAQAFNVKHNVTY